MIGRRGAKLGDLEALCRTRFEVFARVAASVVGAEQARDVVQEALAAEQYPALERLDARFSERPLAHPLPPPCPSSGDPRRE